ncbi:MAG: hypothetical protein ACPK85_12505 [Methanosarcina sp.]
MGNILRTVSLGLQIKAMFSYILGFIALKTASLKKDGILRHAKINNVGYALGSLSLLYMMYSAINLIISKKAPAIMFIHGTVGGIAVILSTLFVANKWKWKSINHMRAFVVLWLMAFSGGLYLFALLSKRK